MDLKQKLRRLLAPYKLGVVAQAASLSPNSMTSILDPKGPTPRVATVTALAAVLGVDAGWLIDDSKGFPPVRVGRPGLDDFQPKAKSRAGVAA